MMSRMAEAEAGVTLAERTEKAANWANHAVCTAHNLHTPKICSCSKNTSRI